MLTDFVYLLSFLSPFFGAEFQGEIPKKFRHLSFYVYEVGNKNKVCFVQKLHSFILSLLHVFIFSNENMLADVVVSEM